MPSTPRTYTGPHSWSSRKRVRQTARSTARNRPLRTAVSHTAREAREAIEDGAPEAAELVRAAQSALDRAARHNVIHPNAASRRKARMARALKGMQSRAG